MEEIEIDITDTLTAIGGYHRCSLCQDCVNEAKCKTGEINPYIVAAGYTESCSHHKTIASANMEELLRRKNEQKMQEYKKILGAIKENEDNLGLSGLSQILSDLVKINTYDF